MVRKNNTKNGKREELKRHNNFRLSLYESYREDVIPYEDFLSFKAGYDVKIQEDKVAITTLKEEIDRLLDGNDENYSWIELFKSYINSEILERKMVVELIKNVAIYEDGRIEISFRYHDEFERLYNDIGEIA